MEPSRKESDPSARPPGLLAVARERMRTRHLALRTEQAFLQWMRRYIAFHDRRHPRRADAGAADRGMQCNGASTAGKPAPSAARGDACASVLAPRREAPAALPRDHSLCGTAPSQASCTMEADCYRHGPGVYRVRMTCFITPFRSR